MSFEWWSNYEITETQKTSNDLKEVSTTKIENSNRRMKEIRQAEIEDLDDLQIYEEFFDSWWDTLELDKHIENWIDQETKTKEIQESLYEKLWINLELEQNPDIKKFVKWLLDWLIVNNLEEIEQLLESSINELVEMFESLLNPEILAELIKQLVNELWDIWNTLEDPYKWWLAIWVLWIWPIGKILKWLKLGKWKNNELIKKTWNWELYEIKGREWKDFSREWPNYVWWEIGDFAESIDVKLLLKEKKWFNNMLSWVDKISSYIENNIDNILKLDIIKLNNFRDNISILRKKIKNINSLEWLDIKDKQKINIIYWKLNYSYKILLNKK